MKSIKGPAIFLAQFMGDNPPFNNLENICKWAANLGLNSACFVMEEHYNSRVATKDAVFELLVVQFPVQIFGPVLIGAADVFKTIDLHAFEAQLIRQFSREHTIHKDDLQPVELNPDQAVPLSLLVTEAVTNAVKYAGAPEGQVKDPVVAAKDVEWQQVMDAAEL